MSYADTHALVTGGSSGIGKATACRLAAAGAHVTILARDEERIRSAVEEIRAVAAAQGQRIEGMSADVGDYDQIATLAALLDWDGRVPDYLFSSAGICRPGRFQELPLNSFREQMEVNYYGTLHIVKAVAPLMMRRRSGHIITISSGAGFVGAYGYSAYSATKYAVRGLSEVLRAELRPYGVRVSIVFPPDTDTPQLHEENMYKPPETKTIAASAQMMSADAVAREILSGVARGRFIILPGWESKVGFAIAGVWSGLIRTYFDYLVRKVHARAGGPPAVDQGTPVGGEQDFLDERIETQP